MSRTANCSGPSCEWDRPGRYTCSAALSARTMPYWGHRETCFEGPGGTWVLWGLFWGLLGQPWEQ
eukprot:9350695-Pyramimonas_sp.AAC.1